LRACCAKSCRLKKVALSWLHGGHQVAPQYSKTGFFCSRAWAKARSMSASAAAGTHATLVEGRPGAAKAGAPARASTSTAAA
jgi:hypothetical protein